MEQPPQPQIRTRFAPSPTGFMHVGNLRTGLFAWLTARNTGGTFVLRLEDTDKNREVEGSADHILACLDMLGLERDEGVDEGGPFAPYRQSDRLDVYKKWAQKLIDDGRAYADPYTPAEVQAFREQAHAAKKPFLYRNHRPEHPHKWDGSQPLRFKSDPKPYTFHDEVMGDVSTGPEVIDDFILIKSDGYPTYNFAHIVDDTEMQITHVIRGQEFISSMPNFLNLYEALGFDMQQPGAGTTPYGAAEFPAKIPSGKGNSEFNQAKPAAGSASAVADSFSGDSAFPAEARQDQSADSAERAPENDVGYGAGFSDKILPTFAHMPHIMNEQGNKKLGKRDGAKDVMEYVREGYLPEALLSFIATMGWNDGTEQEVFTRQELIEKFSLSRVQRSGARFDEKRLLWMNGEFIRSLSLNQLAERVQNYWPKGASEVDEDYRMRVLALAQDRLKTLLDLPKLTSFFFAKPDIDLSLITTNKQLKKYSADELKQLLKTSAKALEAIDVDWTAEEVQATLNELLIETGQKPGVLFSIIRIATTWAPFSPGLDETLELLGKHETLARLRDAREAIGDTDA